MKLSRGTGADVVDPTPDQIVEAIRSLPGGMDSFVILTRSENQFLQTLGSRQEGFHLEYKESEARHFVATDAEITETQLIQTFLAYLDGDDSWKRRHQWTTLKASGGCRNTAVSVLAIALGAALFLITTITGCASAPVSRDAVLLDHVVIGVPDLQSAMAHLERLTGVRPVAGGEHPGRGTHNALLSLGRGTYLELIAPRPDAGETPHNAELLALTEPTPIGWAVATSDSESLARSLRALRFAADAPIAGSRNTPASELLEWRTFGLEPEPEGAPFFIEWNVASPHPSQTSPSGCTLEAFQIASPDDAALRRLVAGLRLNVAVRSSSTTRMSVTLQCPSGRVHFPKAD
jgi:hypothetical protein